MADRVSATRIRRKALRLSVAVAALAALRIRPAPCGYSALLKPIASIFVAMLMSSAANADSLDPTRPPPGFSEQPGTAAPAQQEAALAVSSLFLMGAKPYAVVDGQIVRLGDPLAGGRVAKIDAAGVWIALPGGGKTKTSMRQLKWLPEVVKTPAKAPPSARMEKK
jgi:hypothetical protein